MTASVNKKKIKNISKKQKKLCHLVLKGMVGLCFHSCSLTDTKAKKTNRTYPSGPKNPNYPSEAAKTLALFQQDELVPWTLLIQEKEKTFENQKVKI